MLQDGFIWQGGRRGPLGKQRRQALASRLQVEVNVVRRTAYLPPFDKGLPSVMQY